LKDSFLESCCGVFDSPQGKIKQMQQFGEEKLLSTTKKVDLINFGKTGLQIAELPFKLVWREDRNQ
jgi:hypothetical protein